jgi:hypothetical protein
VSILSDEAKRLCGYDSLGNPKISLIAVQQALQVRQKWPTVTEAEINACVYVSDKSANDIVKKHRGKIII